MGFQNNDTTESVSLINYDSNTQMITQLNKGDSNKVILATKVEANNSDVIINSVDINLSGSSIQP
jgi:cytochrome c-type biogenesis protein CcmH/NrfF